jgi:hypothetical protein
MRRHVLARIKMIGAIAEEGDLRINGPGVARPFPFGCRSPNDFI